LLEEVKHGVDRCIHDVEGLNLKVSQDCEEVLELLKLDLMKLKENQRYLEYV
jgi:hypothetical protein